MRTGLEADARVHLPRPRHRWLRHLLLTTSLTVVVLSIVGMHQLSVGHDVATGPTTSSHAESVHGAEPGAMLPTAMAEHTGDHFNPGTPTGVPGGVCPDCADHQMALGSCLLALTLLVLSWLLAPPRACRVLPFLLPRLAPAVVVSTVARLVPSLSLAELSVLRT